MKKMVKTLACVLTTAALLFAVTGCTKSTDGGTPAETKADPVTYNYLSATYDNTTGKVSAISTTDTNSQTAVKGTSNGWASELKDILSVTDGTDGVTNKVLKFAPDSVSADQYYIGTWPKASTDFSKRKMTVKFYVSNEYAAVAENSPHIKLMVKDGVAWGEQKFIDEPANTMKKGWHTWIVDFKNEKASLDGTDLDLETLAPDFTKKNNIAEIDIALDASAGAMPASMKAGYLYIDSIYLEDAD